MSINRLGQQVDGANWIKKKLKNQIDRGKNEQLPYRRLNDFCVKVDVT